MNLLVSEWTKLRSLRSTWLAAAITLVLGVGVGVLAAAAQGQAYADLTADERADWDPTATSLTSIIVAQLAIGVLGTLVMTSEYATGMITPSLVAAPRRGRLLAAKAGVLTAVALLLGQVIGFVSFLVGQSVIAASGAPSASLAEPTVLRGVVGAGLYLAVIGLLGLALGTILRSSAAAITVLVSITLLVRAVAAALPSPIPEWVDRYWPTAAGTQIINVVPVDGLPPWAGFGILCGFVAVTVAAGYVLLRSRDA